MWLSKTNGLGGSPLVVGDVCIVGGRGALYAFQLDSGRKCWRFKVNGDVCSSPAYADGVLYFKTDDTVYAIDAATGSRIHWKIADTGDEPCGPCLYEDSAIFGSSRMTLMAVDKSTGKRRWDCSFKKHQGNHGSTLAVSDGIVVAKDCQGRVHGIDARQGKRLWVYDLNGKADSMGNGGPAIAGGTVVVVTVEYDKDEWHTFVEALDLKTGERLWRWGGPLSKTRIR